MPVFFWKSHSGQQLGLHLIKSFNLTESNSDRFLFHFFLFKTCSGHLWYHLWHEAMLMWPRSGAGGRKCTGNGSPTHGMTILQWKDAAWNCNYEKIEETSRVWKTCVFKVEQLGFFLPPLLLLNLTSPLNILYHFFFSSANMIQEKEEGGEISHWFFLYG